MCIMDWPALRTSPCWQFGTGQRNRNRRDISAAYSVQWYKTEKKVIKLQTWQLKLLFQFSQQYSQTSFTSNSYCTSSATTAIWLYSWPIHCRCHPSSPSSVRATSGILPTSERRLYRHIKAAFDSVDRAALWKALRSRLSEILVENRDFFHTPLRSTPPLGGCPPEYCHPLWCRKTSMVGLPDDKKIQDMLSSVHRIPACDRQTDGRTDSRAVIKSAI